MGMKYLFSAVLLIALSAITTFAQPTYSLEAEQRFRSALDAFESGEFTKAFSGFQDVYEKQPLHLKSTAAYLMAAKALFQLGEHSRVITLLGEFLNLYATSSYREEAYHMMTASQHAMQSIQMEEKSFRLGIALPVAQSSVTRSLFKGILLSVEAHNRWSDSKIKIIFRDTGNSPEGASVATNSLIDEGVSVIIGPLFSEQVDAVAKVTEKHEVVLIAPLATDIGITSPYTHVFQVNTTTVERGRAIARESIDYLNLTEIGIITESGSDPSQEIAQGFIEELNLRDLTPIFIYEVESLVDWTRLPNLIEQNALAAAQAILFAIDQDNENQSSRNVHDGVNSIGQAGYQPYILAPYSFQSLALYELQTQIRAFFVNPYYENDLRAEVHTFIRDFKESYQGINPDQFAYIGYDVMQMLLDSFRGDGIFVDQIMNTPVYDGVRLRIRFEDHRRNTGMYFFEQTPIGPQLIR